MKTKKEIETRIRAYDYMATTPHLTQITRAIAHEKAEVLRWVLERTELE